MRILLLVCALLLGLTTAEARGVKYTPYVNVHSYTTKSGKHVNSYVRTAPDSTRLDNWSTKGNVNPFTGKKGTKPIDEHGIY